MTERQERAFIHAAFTAAGSPASDIQASESLPVPVVLNLYSDTLLTNLKKAREVHGVASILDEDEFSKHLVHMLTYGPDVNGELNAFLANPDFFCMKLRTLSPVEDYVYKSLRSSPYTLTDPSLKHSHRRFQVAGFSYIIKEWNEDGCHNFVNRAGILFESLYAQIVEAPRFQTRF